MLENPFDELKNNIINSSYFLDDDTDTGWCDKSDYDIICNYPLIGNVLSDM